MFRNLTKNRGGSTAFKVKVDMLVTAGTFCTLLTEAAMHGEVDLENLSRQQAFNAVKSRLYFHGISGVYSGQDSTDQTEEFNSYYPAAEEWVQSNYPMLFNSH